MEEVACRGRLFLFLESFKIIEKGEIFLAILKKIDYTDTWEKAEPLIKDLGADILYWKETGSRNGVNIEITLFHPEGVSFSLIEKVHHLLLPRLEALLGSSVSLDISSPGMNRSLKSLREFPFFIGKEILIYSQEKDSPIQGILEKVQEDSIIVACPKEKITVTKSSVTQAKLI